MKFISWFVIVLKFSVTHSLVFNFPSRSVSGAGRDLCCKLLRRFKSRVAAFWFGSQQVDGYGRHHLAHRERAVIRSKDHAC